MHVSVREWLQMYDEQISSAQQQGQKASDAVRAQWELLESGEPSEELLTSVAPLLTTQWDQDGYYNMFCPTVGNEPTYTGCIATAMAQVMKYWNHPRSGRGWKSHPFYGGQRISFDSAIYRWHDMPARLSSIPHTATAQDSAVALLMFHCGVAVEMSYGTNVSGAMSSAYGGSGPCQENALKQYFGYAQSLYSVSRSAVSEQEWLSVIRREIDEGRPVLHSGASSSTGHAFVCDGYDNASRLHINWGWSGSYDGYFANNAFNPSGGGSGSNSENSYNQVQDILVGIRPEWDAVPTWQDSFENELAYWTVASSANGRWTAVRNASQAHSGAVSAQSQSSSTSPDNWLISPLIHCPVNDTVTFTYYIGVLSAATMSEQYTLYISTTGNRMADFTTPLFSETLSASGYVERSVKLRNYVGQDVFLAIRHHGSSGQSGLCIDDASFAIHPSLEASYNITAFPDVASHGSVSGVSPYAVREATLSAEPAEGYRFERWSDGSRWSPRWLQARGNKTLTAYFVPIRQGDTLSRTNGSYTNRYRYGTSAFGYTTNISWSVTFPKSVLNHRDRLTAVEYFPLMAGSYGITITNGDSIQYTCTAQPTQVGRWCTYYIDTALYIDTAADLYVRISSRRAPIFVGEYPIRAILNGRVRYAGWHEVAVLSNNASMGSVSGEGFYPHDTVARLVATPASGFYFRGWSDGDTNNPRLATIRQDTSFTAVFSDLAPWYHELTVMSSDLAYGTATGGGYYTSDSAAVLTATAIGGAHFSRWSDGNTDNPRRLFVTHDMTLTAIFASPQAIYVQVRTNDSTLGVVSGEGWYDEGDYFYIDAYATSKGRFTRWVDSSSDGYCYVNLCHREIYLPMTGYGTPWGDTTFTAVFEPHNLLSDTLSYIDINWDGTWPCNASFSHQYDTTWWAVKYDTAMLRGRTQLQSILMFAGRVTNGQFTLHVYQGGDEAPGTLLHSQPFSASSSNGWRNIPLTPVLTVDTLQPLWIVISATGDAQDELRCERYMGSTGSAYLYFPGIGWRINSIMGTDYVNGYYLQEFDPSLNSIYGSWAIHAVMPPRRVPATIAGLSADPSHGSVTGGGTYGIGAWATLTAVPQTGYRFSSWHDGNTSNPRSVLVTGNATYTANFVATYFTCTVRSASLVQGTVVGGGTYQEGSNVTITATPKVGYRFSQWDDQYGNQFYNASLSFSIWENMSFIARFEPATYTLTLLSNGGGRVEGAGVYPANTSVDIAAYPSAGYRFVNWSDGSVQARRSIVLSSDFTLTANFERDGSIVHLEVRSQDTTKGTVSGSGQYAAGSTVSITAYPKPGYAFSRWMSNEVPSSRSNPYSVELNSDVTITALFTAYNGIEQGEVSAVQVGANGRQIVIEGASNQAVQVYDMLGRSVYSSPRNRLSKLTLPVPHVGVYMVQVGALPAFRVVIME